jgi:two-component system sensor histidine kinase BaeS
VAIYLARRTSRPLIQAVRTTQRIAGGDLDVKIPLDPREDPELAALGTAINHMTASLKDAKTLERQFLLSISHEFRTPLTSIRGYAEAIADGTTPEILSAVGIIAEEAARLDRLVEDLLDLARLDAQRFSLDQRPVSCREILTTVLRSFQPEAHHEGIILETDLSDDPLWVTADPDRLGQVIGNLLANATRYGAQLVVVGGFTDAQSTTLWVQDDGPGIAPQDLPRVFERHFRADRYRSTTRGSGLGLAIVAELVSAMGGTVRAESPTPAGPGTRMEITFPAGAPAGKP